MKIVGRSKHSDVSGSGGQSYSQQLSSCLKSIFALDMRSLALFRIGLAITLLFDLTVRSADLRIFYTDTGVLPRSVIVGDPAFGGALFSIFFLTGWYWIQVVLFCVAFAAAVALLVGYRTRSATFLSWLLLISLQTRTPLLMQGDDVVRRMLLFWSLFLPLGAVYSFDRALAPENEQIPPVHTSWATFALCLQISIIYWFTALAKTSPVWLYEGTGIYYALSLENITRPFSQIIYQHYDLMRLISYTVVPFELCVPFLLYSPLLNSPLRIIAITTAIGFHIALALCLTIGIFSATCIVAWIALLPSPFWNYLIRHTKHKIVDRRRWHVYYDSDCGFCVRVIALLKTFLFWRDMRASPAQSDSIMHHRMNDRNSWVVIDDKGTSFYEFEALARLCITIPYIGWIMHLFVRSAFVRWGNYVYRWVASHRTTVGKTLTALNPEKSSFRLSKLSSAAIPILLLYITSWNLRNIHEQKLTPYFPHRLDAPGLLLRLDQKWGMFAPYPIRNDGWLMAVGTLKDGSQVDLLRGTKSVDWRKPENLGTSFKNYRWRQYLLALALRKYTRYRPEFANYLRRHWDDSHVGDKELKRVRLYFMLRETQPAYKSSKIKRILLNEMVFQPFVQPNDIGIDLPAAILKEE